jgi:hypothetical protein
MLGQEFGFVAVREGSKLDFEADAGATALLAPGKPAGIWLRIRVEANPDRYLLGQVPKTRAELTEILSRAVRSVSGTKVLIVTPESTPFARVREALEAVQAAGVRTIRLAPSIDEP